jgi:hypothetical protein
MSTISGSPSGTRVKRSQVAPGSQYCTGFGGRLLGAASSEALHLDVVEDRVKQLSG